MSTLRILSGRHILEAVNMKEIIDAMETAFIELSAGRAEMPVRSHISIDQPSGTALFMPSYMRPTEMIGVKTVTLFEDNWQHSIPFIQGMVCLFDGNTGTPRAVLDGMTITALRTGAASGLATRLLARGNCSTATIFGAGVQGRSQLEAVCAVRDIRKAVIYDTSPAASSTFAKEMSAKLNIGVTVAESAEEATRDADIICCATISSTPVFSDRDIPAGVHINAVGSYKPHVQEVPEDMVLRSRLYVDHRESALSETGDLIIPITKGLMTKDHIIAELGEVAAGNAPARKSAKDITFFKSVGVAVQDLAAATVALRKAEQLNIGTIVDF